MRLRCRSRRRSGRRDGSSRLRGSRCGCRRCRSHSGGSSRRWNSNGHRRSWALPSGSRSGIASLPFGGCRVFGFSVLMSLSLNGAANLFSNVHRDRTGMGLFFRDTEARQKVDDGLCFDFELAGQLVNSNLICVGHAFRLDHLLLRICLVAFFGNFASVVSRFGNRCRLGLGLKVWLAGSFGRQFRGDFIAGGSFGLKRVRRVSCFSGLIFRHGFACAGFRT